jgi:dipeptidyl aminopeptidase/acylaminoacyl peptidase
MHVSRLCYFFTFIVSLLFLTCFGQEPDFNVEKMWSLERLNSSSVSPDGKHVFYQLTSYSVEENKGVTRSFVLRIESNTTKSAIESGAWNINWISSNELIYLIVEGENTVLKKYNIEKEASTPLHNFGSLSVDGIVFSKDNKRFACLETIKIKEPTTSIYTDLPLAKARVETSLMYRHWNQWSTEFAPHLFWYEQISSGAYVKKADIMDGEPYPSVLQPFGGIESVCFSKDGQVIYYSTKKLAGTKAALSTNSDVYAYRTKDKITTTLTSAHKGYDSNPSVNFSGKTLAWLSMEKEGFEADKNNLRIMDLSSRKEKNLTAELDLTVEQFSWHPTLDVIFFTAPIKGSKQLFSVDLKTGKIIQITKDQSDFVHFTVAPNHVLIERQSMIVPTDLWILNTKGNTFKQLTFINEKALKTLSEPTVKEKWITTTDGKKMLTWVIYPPNYNPSKKYPTLLYCQGGPQSMVSQYFSYRWNFRLMASEGYIIVAPNRRGLPGFGQEWNDAISKDWGGQAMKDYLVAIDSCIASEPAINSDKLGAVGASYGGYSVYYLAGIHNKRFKAFVSHCGLFNLESWYGTTEELFFANWDQGGPYWLPENKAYYEANSPHNYAQNWDTPMLVIHGAKDFRVPESEGMQAFNVLQLKNIPSKYLLFPEEGHWITKPQNGILWYREYFSFLGTHLK